MCSFMYVDMASRRNENNDELTSLIQMNLLFKGSEYFSILLLDNNKILKEVFYKSPNDASLLVQALNENPNTTRIVCFSRQRPEMETSKEVIIQPYVLQDRNEIICVHGTIPLAEEIAKSFNVKINIDTEIFKHLDYKEAVRQTELVNGKISSINIPIDSEANAAKIRFHNNGLGLYQYMFINQQVIFITNNEMMHEFENIWLISDFLRSTEVLESPGNRVVAAFSGGLDITCSTQVLLTQNTLSCDLVYFDWGTRARAGEIKSGKNFIKKMKKKYPNIEFNHHIIKIKPFMKNILENNNIQNSRLTDESSTGAGEVEAESALSYVPYRNTFFATYLGSLCETWYPKQNVNIVFGANLSEGMVYLDNSANWLQHINKVIKLGGQNSFNFNVVAPFVNITKTNMITYSKMKDFVIDTSFSCYFPDGDKECGTCGSCLLKQAALANNNVENNESK